MCCPRAWCRCGWMQWHEPVPGSVPSHSWALPALHLVPSVPTEPAPLRPSRSRDLLSSRLDSHRLPLSTNLSANDLRADFYNPLETKRLFLLWLQTLNGKEPRAATGKGSTRVDRERWSLGENSSFSSSTLAGCSRAESKELGTRRRERGWRRDWTGETQTGA